MKLHFFKAIALASLIAIPNNTRCDDFNFNFLSNNNITGWGVLIVGAVASLSCGAYYYFSPSDEKILERSQEAYKKSLDDFNLILEKIENVFGQKESWQINEIDLEILRNIGYHESDLYKFYNQITELQKVQNKLQSRIKDMAKKQHNTQEQFVFEKAEKTNKEIDFLLNRFKKIHGILENNKNYFKIKNYEQQLKNKYADQFNISLNDLVSLIKKRRKSAFPLYNYIQEIDQEIINSEHCLNDLSKYPETQKSMQTMYSNLKNIKTTITANFEYQNEVLDFKTKLAEEKEKRAQEKLRAAERKEQDVKRKEVTQAVGSFITAFDQELQQARIDQEKKQLKQERYNIERERNRILQQLHKQQTSQRENLAADLAAKAGQYARNEILNIQAMPPINPELLNFVDMDYLIHQIEQEEFNAACQDLEDPTIVPRKYSDAELQQRVVKKVEKAFGIDR